MVFESRTIPSVKIKTSGTIKKALDAYRAKKVPMRAMLTDYLAVKSKSDLLAEADNPWAYYYKGIEGHEVESGVSHEETLFRFAAMELKNQEPSDVIDAAFYTNRKRNDYEFELGYLVPFFLENTNITDRILVVNPSPGVICALEESGYKERHYAISDVTVQKLYKLQFSDAEFCTFDSMSDIRDIDALLIINRDQKVEMASIILESLHCCKESAKVIGLVPCAWLDNPLNGAHKAIAQNGFEVVQLLVVDPKATVSSPRKKILIVLEKGSEEYIETTQTNFDEKTRVLYVSENAVRISADSYLQSDKTILACIKDAQRPDEHKKPIYQKAQEYKFSDEISLFYKLYSGRKNRYAGVAYYREIKDANQRTWGKKLSSDVEKGLRADSKEGVVGALENLVYEDALYSIIRADIKEKYIDAKRTISLKGLWFYCWAYIVDLNKYDHEFVARLFMNTDIAQFYPQIQSGNELLHAVARSLDVDIEDISYKVIIQIDLIFKAAIDHGILRFDPLESFVADYTKRATERQQDVRNALVKKHFSSNEEMTIFKAIVKPRVVNRKREFSCTHNSLLLAAAIRLFTGMSIRETVALNWDDFVPIEGTEGYQFRITRFVDAKGRVNHHSERENWNRFRVVPSAAVLSFLLNERKRFLLDNGIDEEYLKDCPIIIENDSIERMQEGKTIKHCKPSIVSSFCKEIIKTANIPENEVVLPDDKNDIITDFNRYHGDIYLSNFRHKANHEAFLTMGEINYMIGVNAPNTFSHHYSDYSHDILQNGIIQKLCRWEYCYELFVTKKKLNEPFLGAIEGSGEIKIGPFKCGVAAVDLIVEKEDSSNMIITACSTHGIELIKTEY